MLVIQVKMSDRQEMIDKLEGLVGRLDWDSSSVSTKSLMKLLEAVARGEKRRIKWIE